MVALAINGITSLSVRPIRMIALMGIILFVVFLSMIVWVFGTWVAGHTVQGWNSVMLVFPSHCLLPDICDCRHR